MSDTLGGKVLLDRIVCEGKFGHLLEGLLLVIIAEAVDADEVKSVQQFAAGGVRGVVAVCELVIIDHDTGRRVGRNIVIATFHSGRFIYIGKVGLDHGGDTVGTAECAHHTGLGERVFLLFAACLTDGAFTGGGRKQRAVLPVRMRREIYIGIEPFALGGLADEFTVCRSCRPIHELARLVGAFVKLVDAPIGSEVSGESHILVRGYVPRQRHDDAAARLFGCMSVGGIETG